MTPSPLILNGLVVGAMLFALGLVGILARRNLIVMFLSAELMLQGVSVSSSPGAGITATGAGRCS